MKHLLLQLSILAAVSASAQAPVQDDVVTLNDKDYTISTIIDRELGPGVRYTRLRVPDYPLNVNLLRVDVTNPNVSVETTQAFDTLYRTELLTEAAVRRSSEGHQALAGANANFWCVRPQPPYSDWLVGATYNGNLANGKIITEINTHGDQFHGGIKATGVLAVTRDNPPKVISANNWSFKGMLKSDKFDRDEEIYQVNKIVRDEEMDIYNSYYGADRQFLCIEPYKDEDNQLRWRQLPDCATEVYLTLDDGQQWLTSTDIVFTVADVKQSAGNGTLGSYDLAIVGRGSRALTLDKLAKGDKVTLTYDFIDGEGRPTRTHNLVGGNSQVMINGELTKYNDIFDYNSLVYSRTGYGTDAEGKILYIIVIDKVADPVYGTSAGCPTNVMCQIARHYGCTEMTNFDAGGSAEMLVGDRIVNKTTEATPRPVANGMIIYNTK